MALKQLTVPNYINGQPVSRELMAYLESITVPNRLEFSDDEGITDTSTKFLLRFNTVPLAVNYVKIKNSVTGEPSEIFAGGSDTNIDLLAHGALTGNFMVSDGTDTTKRISFEVSGATTGTKTTLNYSQTADRDITYPDATDTLVGRSTTDTLTNKNIDCDNNTVTNVGATEVKNGLVSNQSSATLTKSDSILFSDADDSDNLKKTTVQDVANLGGRVYLGSYTVSGASTQGITSLITVSGADYEIDYNLTVDTNGETLALRTSSTNSATGDSDSTDYEYAFKVITSGGGESLVNSTGDSSIHLADDIGSAAGESISGTIRLRNPLDSSVKTLIQFHSTHINDSGTPALEESRGSGFRDSTGAVNSAELITISGNMTGTVDVYLINNT